MCRLCVAAAAAAAVEKCESTAVDALKEVRGVVLWGTQQTACLVCVLYLAAPHREDFDPDKCENTAALGLLQRFVSNGREADGSPTRDRLKLIVR